MTEPSAWLYERRDDAWPPAPSFIRLSNKRWIDDPLLLYWTETPLYRREAIEAEIVAWLREVSKGPKVYSVQCALQDAASMIEHGEYRSKSDG